MDKKKLYSISDAAKYLNVKPQVIKDAYYRSKKLQGQTIGDPDGPPQGRRVVFTRKQLDDFAAIQRKPGRPLQPDTPGYHHRERYGTHRNRQPTD